MVLLDEQISSFVDLRKSVAVPDDHIEVLGVYIVRFLKEAVVVLGHGSASPAHIDAVARMLFIRITAVPLKTRFPKLVSSPSNSIGALEYE